MGQTLEKQNNETEESEENPKQEPRNEPTAEKPIPNKVKNKNKKDGKSNVSPKANKNVKKKKCVNCDCHYCQPRNPEKHIGRLKTKEKERKKTRSSHKPKKKKRARKMAIHIKDSDDLKNRLTEAGEKLVVIDFMATWCGPCKMIGPKLEEMANEMADGIVVLKIDVDECEDIAAEYNVNSMPTFVFVKSGKKLEEFSGANPDKLKSFILKYK